MITSYHLSLSKNGGEIRKIRFVVLPLIVAAVAVTGCSGPERDSAGMVVEAGAEQVQDIRVGDCVEQLGNPGSKSSIVSGDVGVVPCDKPHRFEAYRVTDSALTSFSDMQLQEEADSLCSSAFQNYVGIAFERSALNFTSLIPTPEGWRDGDREITCALMLANESSFTGSLRGSAQ